MAGHTTRHHPASLTTRPSEALAASGTPGTRHALTPQVLDAARRVAADVTKRTHDRVVDDERRSEMNEEPVRRLEMDLTAVTGTLAGLEPAATADLDRMSTLVAAAIAQEDDVVRTSLDAAIDALPRPIRGRARALLLEGS